MKQIQSALALAVLASFLAGCAATAPEAKKEAPAKPAAMAASTSAADATVKKDVEAALKKEEQLAGEKVMVQAKDGEVTLTGTTKNDWLKYLSEETAKSVKGVKSVKNSIKVPE